VLPDYLRGERFANLTSAHFNDEQGEQVSTVHLATDTITVALCADTRTVRRIWPSVEYRYSSHIRTTPGSGAYLAAGRTDEAITLLKQTLHVAKAPDVRIRNIGSSTRRRSLRFMTSGPSMGTVPGPGGSHAVKVCGCTFALGRHRARTGFPRLALPAWTAGPRIGKRG
jgi:hypothetical protein